MKQDKEKRASELLASQPWAKELVSRARPGSDEESSLFELRFAYEATRCGISLSYEWPTGVFESSVDFRILGAPSWNVELVSPKVSLAIQDARTIQWPTPLLDWEEEADTFPLVEDDKGSPPRELFRLRRQVLEKVFNRKEKRPTKFPVPDGSAFNVIVFDTRSFLGGGALIDRDDLRQLAYGASSVHTTYNVATCHSHADPIRGLFEADAPSAGEKLFRERIHMLVAIHEQTFDDDEIRQSMVLLPNPNLMSESDARTFPMRWITDLPSVSRAENPLWNDG